MCRLLNKKLCIIYSHQSWGFFSAIPIIHYKMELKFGLEMLNIKWKKTGSCLVSYKSSFIIEVARQSISFVLFWAAGSSDFCIRLHACNFVFSVLLSLMLDATPFPGAESQPSYLKMHLKFFFTDTTLAKAIPNILASLACP